MKKVLSLILLVVMAAAIVACGGENEPQQAPLQWGGGRNRRNRKFLAVGDRVKIGDFFITVKKRTSTPAPSGTSRLKMKTGSSSMFELENASDETVHVSSLLMFALYDEEKL